MLKWGRRLADWLRGIPPEKTESWWRPTPMEDREPIPECTAVETVVEDCRPNRGRLSEGVQCLITRDPRCEHHRKLWENYEYGPDNTAEGRG